MPPRARGIGARCCSGADPAGDTSRSDIVTVVDGISLSRGRLPGPLHDAAAVTLGGRAYLFGGGNGTAQLDAVLRVDPETGAVRDAGRLPALEPGPGGGRARGTAYVVGGYTGTRWLDTVVAWRPGRGSRVARPTCRADCATRRWRAAGQVIIAGGSRPDGAASDVVLAFDPRTRPG